MRGPFRHRLRSKTYHPQEPKYRIVNKEPCLFGESSQIFLVRNTTATSQWREDVVHRGRPQSCKDDNPVENHPDIIPTGSVFARLGIVIGQLEKFTRVSSSAGEADMCEGEQREEIYRKPYRWSVRTIEDGYMLGND